MMNTAQLMARFDPHYQMKLHEIQQIVAKEQYRANANMEVERYRSNDKWQQMQYTARQENQLEAKRSENALAVTQLDHKNKLVQMQADLENRLALSGFESGILATHKILDEDNNRRASMLSQMAHRSQLRGEVFKMLAGALIDEKLAQKQHKRDIEKMNLESSLKNAEVYFAGVCSYLWRLLDVSKEQEAKAEIDRLYAEWGAGNA